MSRILRADAICLSSTPWRETSKLVTFFTLEHGKLLVRAKGARRVKSKFGAALEIMTLSRIVYYRREERTAQTLSDAEILDDFSALRDDHDRLRAGAVMLEFTNRNFETEAANPAVFRLLKEALETLDRGEGDSAAVAFAYMFKAAGRLGYHPQLSHCLACHRPKAAAFSARRGGLLCAQCLAQEPDALRVTAPILRRLRSLYYDDFATNIRHKLSPEVEAMVLSYVQFHFERFELKSLRFLGK